MRVHIVCDRLGADRILPRKARYLIKNNWTIGEQPSTEAEANYFMNYIPWRQRFNNWHDTRIAAYFTHKDLNNPAKAKWWEDSAEAMDLCITSSKLNLEWLPKKRTMFARPPVEIKRFVIAERAANTRPVVGVAGLTYGDNRKGEKLIEKLSRSALAQEVEFRGSGRGWAVPTKWYSWADMPKFFQSLDVLVVPSLYEGVPMPPLEAMACGIPVVIPTKVGILDDLPSIPGIYRYPVGDANKMIEQVSIAIKATDVDKSALRKVIRQNYTENNWIKDHHDAFSSFFHCVGVERNLPPWKDNSGVYVVAFGGPSRECAKTCINSVHKFMPGLPVALVSTEPLGPEDVFIQQKDKDIGGRGAKLMANDLAPKEWTYILYLDADIELVGDVSAIFKFLQDGYEFIICKDMGKYATANQMIRPDNADECQVTWEIMGTDRGAFQYNGVLMAFRRNYRTRRFFHMWQEEWQRWAKRDQAALLRALYRQPLRMYLLMNQWNATDRYEFPPGRISIVHHNTRARRWGGIVDGRTDGKRAWQAVDKWKAQHGM